MMTIYKMIQDLGIFQTHLGFRYLCYGLQLAVQDEDYLLLLTKALYPQIASHYRTTPTCVEHDIRNAVRMAWRRRQMQIRLEELAGYHFSTCPSTGEIFSILVSYLQRIDNENR